MIKYVRLKSCRVIQKQFLLTDTKKWGKSCPWTDYSLWQFYEFCQVMQACRNFRWQTLHFSFSFSFCHRHLPKKQAIFWSFNKSTPIHSYSILLFNVVLWWYYSSRRNQYSVRKPWGWVKHGESLIQGWSTALKALKISAYNRRGRKHLNSIIHFGFNPKRLDKAEDVNYLFTQTASHFLQDSIHWTP